MRNASIAVLREIGVETGGSNVQFAVNPADGRLVVIEMNPRVRAPRRSPPKRPAFPSPRSPPSSPSAIRSMSSPTTSPVAHARRFEPTIDYVVTKIPRFAFEKFPGAKPCSPPR